MSGDYSRGFRSKWGEITALSEPSLSGVTARARPAPFCSASLCWPGVAEKPDPGCDRRSTQRKKQPFLAVTFYFYDGKFKCFGQGMWSFSDFLSVLLCSQLEPPYWQTTKNEFRPSVQVLFCISLVFEQEAVNWWPTVNWCLSFLRYMCTYRRSSWFSTIC